MDKKRLAIIIGFLVITILLGYAIYRVFFASDEAGPPAGSRPAGETGQFPESGAGVPGTDVATPGQLPESGRAPGIATPGTGVTAPEGLSERGFVEETRLRQLTDVRVKDPSMGATGARFYNEQDGRFYRLDQNGNLVPMSDQVFFNVEAVTWSPVADESIIEYPDGNNIYYNFSTKQQVTLPKHWESFNFSTQGDKIAAKSLALSPENRWLIAADPTGSNIRLVEPLGNNADRVIVDWSPTQQVVALSQTGEELGADRQELLFVGLNKENFKSVVVEGRGLETKWSPSGQKLLHSVHNARNNFRPELWIVDGSGEQIGANRKLLGVNTWAHKCTMADERTVYCGVPETLEAGAGFVPELASGTRDRLMKIDTQTGIRSEIPLEGYHVIKKIFMSQDGKTLYFNDAVQDGLFSVVL